MLFRSVTNECDLASNIPLFKFLYKLLTIAGGFILLCAMFVITYMVQVNKLAHHPDLRIRLDEVTFRVIHR